MVPNVPMPVLQDWFNANVSADHGLQLVLFITAIALSWLFISRLWWGDRIVLSLANILQVVWVATGIVCLVAFLGTR